MRVIRKGNVYKRDFISEFKDVFYKYMFAITMVGFVVATIVYVKSL
ncbi:MAG: hypothetical protein J6S85_20025 [Methanobrevibacter sp.]|nr:hypothetical protein [Methanobrevibacter sp.]